MKSRLAMFACKEPMVTPYTRASGEEQSCAVTGIGELGEVVIEWVGRDLSFGFIRLHNGLNLLGSGGWAKYRVCKRIADDLPTTVEMILDAKQVKQQDQSAG